MTRNEGADGTSVPRRRIGREENTAPFPPCGPETPHLYTPAKHVVTGFPGDGVQETRNDGIRSTSGSIWGP